MSGTIIECESDTDKSELMSLPKSDSDSDESGLTYTRMSEKLYEIRNVQNSQGYDRRIKIPRFKQILEPLKIESEC